MNWKSRSSTPPKKRRSEMALTVDLMTSGVRFEWIYWEGVCGLGFSGRAGLSGYFMDFGSRIEDIFWILGAGLKIFSGFWEQDLCVFRKLS